MMNSVKMKSRGWFVSINNREGENCLLCIVDFHLIEFT